MVKKTTESQTAEATTTEGEIPTIGILGGGQLGRMTAIAAANLGFRVHTYTPKNGEQAPAEQVSNQTFYGEYDDEKQLKKFAESVDIITLEFENIPESTLSFLEKLKPLCPNKNAVYITQNRLREKTFLRDNNIPTAEFAQILSADAAAKEFKKIKSGKAIIKTSQFGYDGKGQAKVKRGDNVEVIWEQNKFTNAIIEEFVEFTSEISVVLSRREDGKICIFPIGQNTHENGILDTSLVPAAISTDTKKQAEKIATNIAELLDYVGTMAVEFFVLSGGKLLVNEIAPRPHNSGHWSLDGCITSQFEQHVRAICGLPFGSVALNCKKIEMINLIGDAIFEIGEYLILPNAKLHLYGKQDAKDGRKMGHVNIID
jgi:5-(carboxyamino)imidazole ribonucleotide synthase